MENELNTTKIDLETQTKQNRISLLLLVFMVLFFCVVFPISGGPNCFSSVFLVGLRWPFLFHVNNVMAVSCVVDGGERGRGRGEWGRQGTLVLNYLLRLMCVFFCFIQCIKRRLNLTRTWSNFKRRPISTQFRWTHRPSITNI